MTNTQLQLDQLIEEVRPLTRTEKISAMADSLDKLANEVHRLADTFEKLSDMVGQFAEIWKTES